MKSKKSSLRAALFLALIGAAFVFTACWQGTPAGGSGVPGSPGTVNPGGNNSGGGIKSGDTNSKNNNSKNDGSKTSDGSKSGDTDSKDSGGGSGGGNTTASSIEGITWEDDTTGNITLLLKGGNATVTVTGFGIKTSDSGKYTINGNTIKFTGFTNPGVQALFNREFKYEIKGDTLTLLDDATNIPRLKFKKA